MVRQRAGANDTTRQGEVVREVEMPAREGERELDAFPPEGWPKPEVLP